MTPGKSNSITINVNTIGLAEGNYSAEIVIADNDPDENPKTMPVTLHVGGGGVGATATRYLPATVELGANFNVTTAASGCGFAGQVVEALPAGFAYVSCTPENIGV